MSWLKPTGSAARAEAPRRPPERSAARIQAEAETDPKTTRTAEWDGFMRTCEQVRQTDDPALDAIQPPINQERVLHGHLERKIRGVGRIGPVLGSPAAVSITVVLRIELRALQG